jgi:hypothetical protein
MLTKTSKKDIPRLSRYRLTEAPNYKALAAFDIETDGMFGEWILGAIKLEGNDTLYQFTNPYDMVRFMMKKPEYDYYAHNASGYDFNYILDALKEIALSMPSTDIKPIKQGDSRIIGFVVKFSKKKLVLKDSLPLLNSSLKKAAKAFAPHIPKMDIGLTDGVTFNPAIVEHMQYLERDCDALIAVMRAVRDITFEKFGSKIGLTAGSTAMNAFKASIPEGKSYYRQTEKVEHFLRQAYYGGYVFPGTQVGKFENFTTLDYTGAYAGQMKRKFPFGVAVRTFTFKEDKIGFYSVIVRVPDGIKVPCVPARTAKGVIYYGSGTFETVIDSETILFAQKRGYQFTILSGYYFVLEENVFEDIINTCEVLEMSDGGVFKAITKLIRNALYGKFGTRIEMEELSISAEQLDGWQFYSDPKTGEDVDNLLVRPVKIDVPYIQLQWAALITSRQRMTLIEKIELLLESGSKTVYGDTDSVIAESDVIKKLMLNGQLDVRDNQYGYLKHEHDFKDIIFLGPKCYGGRVLNEEKEYVLRAKGVPNYKLFIGLFKRALRGRYDKNYFPASNSVYRRLLNPDLPLRIEDGRNRRLTNLINSDAWNLNKDTGEITPKISPPFTKYAIMLRTG